MTDKQTPLTADELRQFTGSEVWYRHGIVQRIKFTEGVKYLADRAGAYWLIDEIALANAFEPNVRREEFQAWKLVLDATGSGASLTCTDGDERIVFGKHISFTDFPLPEIALYFTNDVILLPSEY